MNPIWQRLLTGAVVGCFGLVLSAQDQDKDKKQDAKVVVTGTAVSPTTPARPDATTEGAVTVGGQVIEYRAVAGNLTVGATDTQDAMLGLDGQMLPDTGDKMPDPAKPEEAPPTARMFYAAYFKKGAPTDTRPVTFL